MRRVVAFRRQLALCLLALIAVAEFERLDAGAWFREDAIEGAAKPTRIRLARAADQPADQSRPNDDTDELSIMSQVLAYLDRYLPVVNLNYTLNPSEKFETAQLDLDVESYFEEKFPANMTLDQLQLLAVKATLRVAPMPLHTSWGYESRQDMRLGSLPVQDDLRCAAHLEQLSQRLAKITGSAPALELGAQSVALAKHPATPVENLEAQQLFRSQDLEMLRYLDTFGRVPSDLLRGNVKWYGSYASCLDTRLSARPQLGGTRRIKFRYCMAALKSAGWRQPEAQSIGYGAHARDARLGNYFVRVGVCLPESCDSAALELGKESAQTVERLLKFNLLKPFNSDHYYLSDLYCLPDQRSPLRSVPLLGKLLLLATLGWLALVGAATLVHLNVERFYTKAVREIRRKQKMEELRRNYERNGANESDEEQRVAIAAASMKEREASSELQANEFKELDVLQLKAAWIRLNVFLWDRLTGDVWPHVDLIGCLSLYSNWLRYTQKLKLAVARLHADEQRRARIKLRNQQLVERVRGRRHVNFEQPDSQPEQQQQRKEPQEAGAELTRDPMQPDELAIERELGRRLAARDELDEMEADTVKRKVDTSSLNALKVIALVWIIAGHCVFYLASAVSNSALLKNYVRDLAAFALANGAMYITELFFVITGCLTAYLAFKHNTIRVEAPAAAGAEPSGRPSASTHLESRLFRARFWLLLVANRYLRILPTYLLVYAYVKLVSIYVSGAGPTWDYAVSANSMRRSCAQESWLPVLTLTTNFVDIYQHCIVGGWYLSVDMQFMALGAPLLVLLAGCLRARRPPSSLADQQVSYSHKQQRLELGASPRASPEALVGPCAAAPRNPVAVGGRLLLGYALIVLLALGSGLLAMLYGIYCSEVDMSYILRFVPHAVAMLSRNIAMYTNSVFRFRAFALGLLLGHLLYLHEFGLVRLPKLVQQHGSKLTVAIAGLGFALMFLPVLYPKGKILLSHDVTSVAMILTAGATDLFLCALIFLVCIGKAPKGALFVLNSPCWSVLSSLSLCAFLVHSELIVVLSSQLMPLPSVQYSALALLFCATLLATYALALALHLAFELPLARLVEALVGLAARESRALASDRPADGGERPQRH